MKHSNVLSAALMLVGLLFATTALSASASSYRTLDSSGTLDSNFCVSLGGFDITDRGRLVLGDGTSSAVICQLPAGTVPAARPANTGAAGGLPPLTVLNANFQLPSGTVSFANGQQFNTACVANLSYAPGPKLPAVSHGTSTFNCVGYNNGSKSLGCSVQWSGATDVTAGANPGGQAVAAFSCLILKLQTIQFMSSYTYTDPTYQRINYWAQDLSSSITVTR